MKKLERMLDECNKKLEAINALHESWKNDGTGFYDLFVK